MPSAIEALNVLHLSPSQAGIVGLRMSRCPYLYPTFVFAYVDADIIISIQIILSLIEGACLLLTDASSLLFDLRIIIKSDRQWRRHASSWRTAARTHETALPVCWRVNQN
jgi:hypothetical protein